MKTLSNIFFKDILNMMILVAGASMIFNQADAVITQPQARAIIQQVDRTLSEISVKKIEGQVKSAGSYVTASVRPLDLSTVVTGSRRHRGFKSSGFGSSGFSRGGSLAVSNSPIFIR